MAENPEGKVAQTPSAYAAPQGGEAPAAADTDQSAEKVNSSRRGIIWALIGGYLGVNFLMFLRFFFPRALYEPKTKFRIGLPSDFGFGVDTKFQKQIQVPLPRQRLRQ